MIFWKYIKGFNQSIANDSSDVTNYTTFIEFQNAGTAPFGTVQGDLPIITFASGTKHDENVPSLGHILVSGSGSNFVQEIDSHLIQHETLSFNNDFHFIPESSSDGASLTIQMTNSANMSLKTVAGTEVTLFDIHSEKMEYNINMEGTGAWKHNGYVVIGNAATDTDGEANGSIYIENKCQALYFNATSDKRAKTDIQPLIFNALDLVKRTQLYTFKYKDLDVPSIGILAQDIQDVKCGNFDLVDNKNATGKDMDYMSIHESKLVYILWKAIQEQQEEINALKEELKNGR